MVEIDRLKKEIVGMFLCQWGFRGRRFWKRKALDFPMSFLNNEQFYSV